MWFLAPPILAVATAGALLSGCTDRWAGPTVRDAAGDEYDVRESAAPKACGWEHVRILTVPAVVIAAATQQGSATGVLRYASDPVREAGEALAEPYTVEAKLAPGVVKTRYHKGDRELWIRPDDAGRAIIMLDSGNNTVARWPRIAHPCLAE